MRTERIAIGTLGVLLLTVVGGGYRLRSLLHDRALAQLRAPGLSEAGTVAGLLVAAALLALVAAIVAWRGFRQRMQVAADGRQKEVQEQSYRELMELNARLERAAREWRATADTIDAPLIVLEPDGVIQRMNLAAADTLPNALPLWLGRPSSLLAAYPPWNAALALAENAVTPEEVVTDRVRDARHRTWDLSCRAMPDRKPRTVLVIARNVTAVVEMQESMRRSETMAQLGEIVSGVAHEVRNPLFAISSLVDAWSVQSHRDPKPFVDALRSEVSRLRTLMVDLLEYGRPASSAARQAEHLSTVVDSAVRACSHEATTRGIRIAAEASPDIDVETDPPRLERVFINLIQNAVQHAPAGSVVHVEVSAADASQVAITVRDHGPGFAPEDLPRIFTPFFSRRPGGFGLGLAITERIVNEHGGRLTAGNVPGGGAAVTVWLPQAGVREARDGRRVECA